MKQLAILLSVLVLSCGDASDTEQEVVELAGAKLAQAMLLETVERSWSFEQHSREVHNLTLLDPLTAEIVMERMQGHLDSLPPGVREDSQLAHMAFHVLALEVSLERDLMRCEQLVSSAFPTQQTLDVVEELLGVVERRLLSLEQFSDVAGMAAADSLGAPAVPFFELFGELAHDITHRFRDWATLIRVEIGRKRDQKPPVPKPNHKRPRYVGKMLA